MWPRVDPTTIRILISMNVPRGPCVSHPMEYLLNSPYLYVHVTLHQGPRKGEKSCRTRHINASKPVNLRFRLSVRSSGLPLALDQSTGISILSSRFAGGNREGQPSFGFGTFGMREKRGVAVAVAGDCCSLYLCVFEPYVLICIWCPWKLVCR